MIESAYRYVVVIKDQSGTVRSALPGDFLPCYEDLLYSAVADGKLPNDGQLPRATVEPLWDGGPEGKIRGVEIRLPPLAKPYPLAIFADPVRALWAERCQAQGLEGAPAEVEFSWQIETERIPAKPPAKLQARLSRAPYPFHDRPLASFGIEACGSPPHPIFVSQALLEGLRQDTAQSLEAERADLLIGYLARDGEACPAVIATERVPVRADADPSPIRFTFSPHAFLEAAERAAQHADGATIVGWHHNHPPPCGRGCLQRLPPCPAHTVFFSYADRTVQRASFPAPYMIALVSGKARDRRADDPLVQAYGWQDGVVAAKEFEVFEERL